MAGTVALTCLAVGSISVSTPAFVPTLETGTLETGCSSPPPTVSPTSATPGTGGAVPISGAALVPLPPKSSIPALVASGTSVAPLVPDTKLAVARLNSASAFSSTNLTASFCFMPGLAAITMATSSAARRWNSAVTASGSTFVLSALGRNGAVTASVVPRRPPPIVPPTSAPIAACSNISPASTAFPVTTRGLAYSIADWMASVPPSINAALPIRPSAVLAGAARIPPKPNWSSAVTASAPGATLAKSENSTSCRPSSSVASLAWLPKTFDIPKPGSGAAAAIIPGMDCATFSIAKGIALRRKSFFTSSH